MGISTTTETRSKQREKIVAAVAAREAELAERGLSPEAAAKDPVLRKLKADRCKATRRLTAIEEAKAHVQKAAEQKKSQGKAKTAKGQGKTKASKAQGGGKKAKPKKK